MAGYPPPPSTPEPMSQAAAASMVGLAFASQADSLDVERLTLALWGMDLNPDAREMAKAIAREYARLSRAALEPTDE